jgi:hypothetical protein
MQFSLAKKTLGDRYPLAPPSFEGLLYGSVVALLWGESATTTISVQRDTESLGSNFAD